MEQVLTNNTLKGTQSLQLPLDKSMSLWLQLSKINLSIVKHIAKCFHCFITKVKTYIYQHSTLRFVCLDFIKDTQLSELQQNLHHPTMLKLWVICEETGYVHME